MYSQPVQSPHPVAVVAPERETLLRVQQQSIEQLHVLQDVLTELSSRISGPGTTVPLPDKGLIQPAPQGALGFANEMRARIHRLSEQAQVILNEI